MKTTTDRVSLTDLRDQLRTYKESVLANLVMAGEIPAPTFSEHRRIEFLINRFIESSVSEVSVDDAGNGIGIIKGTGGEQGNGRAILINAHADTVFSEKIVPYEKVVIQELTWWQKYGSAVMIGGFLLLFLLILKKFGKLLV